MVSCCLPESGGSSRVLEPWRSICWAEPLGTGPVSASTKAPRMTGKTRQRRWAQQVGLVSAGHSCMIAITDVIQITHGDEVKRHPGRARHAWHVEALKQNPAGRKRAASARGTRSEHSERWHTKQSKFPATARRFASSPIILWKYP